MLTQALHLRWILRAQGSIFWGDMLHRQQLSWLLKLSCNLAGESQLFDWLGSAQLSGTKPTAQLSSKKKPGWLRQLDFQLAPAPGAAATLCRNILSHQGSAKQIPLIHFRGAGFKQSKASKNLQSPKPFWSRNQEGLRMSWHSNGCALQNTKGCKVNSKIWWFTKFCNSHYVSHFTAFFINARAKRSIVESCINCVWSQKYDILRIALKWCMYKNMKTPLRTSQKGPPHSDAQEGWDGLYVKSTKVCTTIFKSQRQP